MKKLKTIDIYTIPLFFVAVATVVLRSFALLTSFNPESMHFDEKTAITVSSVILAVAVLGFLSYLIFGEKETDLVVKNNGAASYIPAGIVSTALTFMGAHNMYMCFTGGYSMQVQLMGFEVNLLSTMAFICGLLAFLSVGAFFLSIFIEKNDNIYKSAFSLSIVFFLALYALLLYFDKQEHPTNSPNRFVDEMAYLSAALFFLFEARIPLGRTKWRGYVAFGLIATLLCTYSSIPAIILYFANDGYTISESIIESILTLTLAIYALSKVLRFKRLTPDTECDTAKSIRILASMREDEIEENRKLSRAQESINEENDDAEDASNYTFNIPYIDSNTDLSQDDATIDLTNDKSN